MHTSAQPAEPRFISARQAERMELAADKGQKSEPFFVPAIGRDRRSLARELRLDQRR